MKELISKAKTKESHAALLAFVFAVIVFLFSWHSDDAYHSYVMARNLVWGNGLVYNIGYRVNASTCPLFTLLEALFYLVIRNMELASSLLSTISCYITAYILFKKCCKNLLYSLLAFAGMLICYSFMSFTASGLENPLLFMFGVMFLSEYAQNEYYNKKHLFIIALLTSLLAMTRMDIVLIFIPMILYMYLLKTKVKFIHRVFIGLAGLLPFISWCLFSLFYYGFIFPNTFYAKLNVNIPASEFIQRGISYLGFSFAYDLMLLLVPLSLIVLTIRYRNKKTLILITGMLLYYVYVVSIGGDFMVGRHLTVPFFLSLCSLFLLINTITDNKKENLYIYSYVGILVICLILNMSLSKLIKKYFYGSTNNAAITCAADEREFYVSSGLDTLSILSCQFNNQDLNMVAADEFYFNLIDSLRNKGYKGLALEDTTFYGVIIYYAQDRSDTPFYVTDDHGLMDAFVVRLPNTDNNNWRTGHIQRQFPAGFQETISSGANVIEDPNLHEYYDHMNLITAGDLFSSERINTIIDMNTGRYDYLLN
ncbi:MAG: hypothetical protein K6F79_07615 [Saccharofermentans sp.]|nr:hypothetical protein [Saccharofermentans sp.]